jgi:hypothetical protein
MKQLKYLKLPQIVEITWEDACGMSGWKQPYEDGVIVKSVGYLISRSKKGICLAHGLDCEDTQTVLAPSWIPKGMVKKMRRLR